MKLHAWINLCWQGKYRHLPWLIIGKGPSFSRLKSAHLENYNTIGLNHVVQHVPRLDVMHIIDWPVIHDCKAELNRADFVVMPERPNVNFHPADRPQDAPAEFESMRQSSRVITYDRKAGPADIHPIGSVCAWRFSVEVAICVLAVAGVKVIHTIGIDGGMSYAQNFNMQPLTNGQPNFDGQWAAIDKIADMYGLQIIRL
jgi:hypothetical protein